MTHQKPRHPATEPRPFLVPILTGRRAVKYYAVALLWMVAAGWFWAWWLARPMSLVWGDIGS